METILAALGAGTFASFITFLGHRMTSKAQVEKTYQEMDRECRQQLADLRTKYGILETKLWRVERDNWTRDQKVIELEIKINGGK